jgi:hypothetical protein
VHPQHSVEPTAADWGSPLPDQAAKVAEDHKANRQDGHIVHARRTVEEQEHAIAGGRDAEFETWGARCRREPRGRCHSRCVRRKE